MEPTVAVLVRLVEYRQVIRRTDGVLHDMRSEDTSVAANKARVKASDELVNLLAWLDGEIDAKRLELGGG